MSRSHEQYQRQLETSKEWKKANRERHAELARAYRHRNPEKLQAQNRLNYAVRSGVLERKPCEECGTANRVHAHHHDYSKPLDVRWLCYVCHKKAHPVDDEDKAIKFSGAKKARLFGTDNPNGRLTPREIDGIRKMLDSGLSQVKIGKAFDVSQATVSRVKLGKRR